MYLQEFAEFRAATEKQRLEHEQHTLRLKRELENNRGKSVYSYKVLLEKSDSFIHKIIGFRSKKLFQDIMEMHVRRLGPKALKQFKTGLPFEDYMCMVWMKHETGVSVDFMADLFGVKYSGHFTDKLRLVLIMSNWVYKDTFASNQSFEDIQAERDPYFELEPWCFVDEIWDGYLTHILFVLI